MRTTGSIRLLFVVLLAFRGAQGIWKGFGLGLISMLKSQFGGDTDGTLSAENFKNFMTALGETYHDLANDRPLLLRGAHVLSDVLDGKKDAQSAALLFMMGKDGQKLKKMVKNIFESSGQQEFADRLLEIMFKVYQGGDDYDWMKDVYELGIGLKTFLLQGLEYVEGEIRQSQRSYEF